MSKLGVLSIHLSGEPCAVGCPFCYLGARTDELVPLRALRPRAPADRRAELVRAVERLDYAELAVAVSEPVIAAEIADLVAAASSRQRPVALTTTMEIAVAHPELFDGVSRLNLSVDPWKVRGDAEAITAAVARVTRARKQDHPRLEIVAMATLSTPSWAQLLVEDGLLEALVGLSSIDAVALSALKPPPPFCDRAFWLRTLARLRPLLDRALDRRLFLDCYVAARLLGIGGCPARPDLSPAPGGIAFRSCVYAPHADAVVERADELDAVVAGFTPPLVCPFDTRLSTPEAPRAPV